MILPESVEELNLRLKFLWGSSTKIFTMAMEGQKRQTVCLWNDLNHKMIGTHIESFFQIKDSNILKHRKTPTEPDESRMNQKLDNLAKKHYNRSGCSIQTEMCTFNGNCPAMTYRLAFACEEFSREETEKNQNVQEKHINTHLEQILKKLAAKSFFIQPYIKPTAINDVFKFMEKDIVEHTFMVGRLFMEEMARLALEPGNTRMQTLFQAWKQKSTRAFLSFINTNVEEHNDIRDEDQKREKEGRVKLFCRDELDERFEKGFFLAHVADPFCAQPRMQPPKDFTNQDNVADPTKPEFFCAHWAMIKKSKGSQIILAYKKDLTPREHMVMTMVVSCSICDQQAAKALLSLVRNNGSKTLDRHAGSHCHEIDFTPLKEPHVSSK
jgi:hypothetical protein